ncbi:MAG: sulfatase-like hydrolase/transferase, partial [SAR324 cluster bacterium]|nr:sulfatase-like hydrolase/transferase [SAR324 cluster bacterium]
YFDIVYSSSTESHLSLYALSTGLFPLMDTTRSFPSAEEPPLTLATVLHAQGFKTAVFTFEPKVWSSIHRSSEVDLYSDPTAPERSWGVSPRARIQAKEVDRTNIDHFHNWIESLDSNQPIYAQFYLFSSHYPYNFPNAPELPAGLSFLNYPIQHRDMMKTRYSNALSQVDQSIARILDLVASHGREESSLIMITGDHGQMFHEHGRTGHGNLLYDEAIRVPWLVISPKMKKGSLCNGTPVSHIDIFPTVLSVLGSNLVHGLQGEPLIDQNFRPICPPSDRPVFFTSQAFEQEDGFISYPLKYTENYTTKGQRLFNLSSDPLERNNLVEIEPSQAKTLRSILHKMQTRQLSYHSLPQEQRQRYFPPPLPKTSN